MTAALDSMSGNGLASQRISKLSSAVFGCELRVARGVPSSKAISSASYTCYSPKTAHLNMGLLLEIVVRVHHHVSSPDCLLIFRLEIACHEFAGWTRL